MPRPIHFEIPSADPEKAIAFYSKVFNWTFHKWDGPMPYWMISTGASPEPGIDGGLMPLQHPGQPCVNTIGVADLDASVASVVEAGGQVAVPRMAVPGVGWLSYCTDLDGHMFGLMQADAAAS